MVLVTYVPVQINIYIPIMKHLVWRIVHYIGSPNLFEKFTVHLRLSPFIHSFLQKKNVIVVKFSHGPAMEKKQIKYLALGLDPDIQAGV